MAPPENGNEEYPEFCLVFAGELEPGLTLETFFDLMLASLEEDTSESEQLETGEAEVNGEDAKWAIVSIDDSELSTEIVSLIYALVKEPNGYMIMCVAEADQFEDQRDELEGIAESFRID